MSGTGERRALEETDLLVYYDLLRTSVGSSKHKKKIGRRGPSHDSYNMFSCDYRELYETKKRDEQSKHPTQQIEKM